MLRYSNTPSTIPDPSRYSNQSAKSTSGQNPSIYNRRPSAASVLEQHLAKSTVEQSRNSTISNQSDSFRRETGSPAPSLNSNASSSIQRDDSKSSTGMLTRSGAARMKKTFSNGPSTTESHNSAQNNSGMTAAPKNDVVMTAGTPTQNGAVPVYVDGVFLGYNTAMGKPSAPKSTAPVAYNPSAPPQMNYSPSPQM